MGVASNTLSNATRVGRGLRTVATRELNDRGHDIFGFGSYFRRGNYRADDGGGVVVVLQAVKTTKRTGDSLGRIIMYEKDLLKKPHVLLRGKNCYYFLDVLLWKCEFTHTTFTHNLQIVQNCHPKSLVVVIHQNSTRRFVSY